jgi:hypothetical protein
LATGHWSKGPFADQARQRRADPDYPIAPVLQFEMPEKQKPRASVAFVRGSLVVIIVWLCQRLFPNQPGQK